MLLIKCHLLLVKVSFRVCEIEMQTLTLGFAHVVSSPRKILLAHSNPPSIYSWSCGVLVWILLDRFSTFWDRSAIWWSKSRTKEHERGIKEALACMRTLRGCPMLGLQPLCSLYVILDQSLMSILYVMKHSKTTSCNEDWDSMRFDIDSFVFMSPKHNTHSVPNFGNIWSRTWYILYLYGSQQQENCTKGDTKLIWITYHMHLC